METMLKYIELKTGHADKGPAWIGYATVSRTRKTIYFNGRALRRMKGGGFSANHRDVVTGEEFWVSGVKKDGRDRHWDGSGKVLIERAALPEYLDVIGAASLDRPDYEVTDSIVPTDIQKFSRLENRKPHDEDERSP